VTDFGKVNSIQDVVGHGTKENAKLEVPEGLCCHINWNIFIDA
jgi:hypothetical protein